MIYTLGKDKVEVAENVYLAPGSHVIGKVKLATNVSVWFNVVIRGDCELISIGKNTNIQDGSVLHITHAGPFNPDGYPLTIGSDVTVGHKALLHGCTIKDRVLVGMGAIVMDGAVIEEEVILAAGSVVPPGKILESGYLYRGSPAKQIRALSEKERSFFAYSANNYAKLKDLHIAEQN